MVSSRPFTPITLNGMNRKASAYRIAGTSRTIGTHQGIQSGKVNGRVMA
jgi:hypothetical protein